MSGGGHYFPDAKGQRRSGKKLIERKNDLKAAAGEPMPPPKDLVAPGRPIIRNPRTGKPQLQGGQPRLTSRYEINPLAVRNMAAAFYSNKEIAAHIPCDVRTLRKYFSRELEEGRHCLIGKLRLCAYRMALAGVWPASRFLLINYCGMFDVEDKPRRRTKSRPRRPKGPRKPRLVRSGLAAKRKLSSTPGSALNLKPRGLDHAVSRGYIPALQWLRAANNQKK